MKTPQTMTEVRQKHQDRIQQGDAYGCTIACLAMAAGTDYASMRDIVAAYWDVFHPFEKFNGLNCDDEQVILFKMGLRLMPVANHQGDGLKLKAYVDATPAILQVPSLNVRGLAHAVFWTGRQIHDPSPFRTYDNDTAWPMAQQATLVMPITIKAEYPLYGIDGGVA